MLGDVFVCFCLKLLAMFLLHMRISIFQYQFDFSKFFRHSKFACRVQKQQRPKTPARAGERNAKPRLASRGHVTSTCFAHAKKTRIEILKFCSPLKVRHAKFATQAESHRQPRGAGGCDAQPRASWRRVTFLGVVPSQFCAVSTRCPTSRASSGLCGALPRVRETTETAG